MKIVVCCVSKMTIADEDLLDVKRAERHHQANHDNFDPCRECIREQAICRLLPIFFTVNEASDAAEQLNALEPHRKPLLAFYCFWCSSWHLKGGIFFPGNLLNQMMFRLSSGEFGQQHLRRQRERRRPT